MSDEKRPLPDFSIKNEGYGKIDQDPSVPPRQGTAPLRATPANLFSSKPLSATPGSFSRFSKGDEQNKVRLGAEIKKKGPEISPEELELGERKGKLEERLRALLQKNRELFESLNSPNLIHLKNEFDDELLVQKQQEIDEQVSEIISRIKTSDSLTNIAELEELSNAAEKNIKETKESFDEAVREKYEEAQANREKAEAHLKDLELYKERTPLLARYSTARTHAGKLYGKISQETSAEIYGVISKLEWLHDDQLKNRDLSVDEITSQIKELETLIEKGEKEISDASLQREKEEREAEKKQQQEKEVLRKKFIPLHERQIRLAKESEDILHKLADGEGKAKIEALALSLDELKDKLIEETSEALLAGFNDLLDEYSNLLADAKVHLKTLEVRTVPAHDIYSGWPERRITFVKGNSKQRINAHWQFINDEGKIEQLSDTQRWTTEKENFEAVFKEYSEFLRTEDSHYKLENYKDLIKAKNDVIDAFLKKEPILAGNLREVFRYKLKEATDAYKKYTKEKHENENKAKEKKEGEKTLEGRLVNLAEEYNAIAKASETTIVSALSSQEFIDLSKTREQVQNEFALLPKDVPDAEMMDKFEKLLRHFETIVKAANTRIEKQKKVFDRSRPQPRLAKGSDMIKLRDGREITVEEWRREQADKQTQIETEKKIEQSESSDALLETHRDMFQRNKIKYMELYLNKTFVKGDPNEMASKAVFAEYVNELQETKAELLDEKMTLEGTVPGDAVEEDTGMTAQQKIEKIKNQISLIEEDIRKISEGPTKAKLEEIRQKGLEKRTLRATRLTYSPASDKSVAHIPIEGKEMTRQERATLKIAVHEKKTEAEEAGRDKLTQEEVKNMSVRDALLDSSAPNAGGMTRSLDGEPDASGKSDLDRFKEEENSKFEAPTPVPIQTEQTPEQKALKHKHVGKLMDLLSGFEKKNNGNWRFWILAGTIVALGGAASIIANKKEEQVPQARTLQQLASWKDYLQTPQLKIFVKDLYGKDKLDYVSFMKKHLPSININEKNPSTIAAISAMECEPLFNSPGKVYGLEDTQRQEACIFARNMEAVIQATDANYRMTAGFKQNDFSFANSKTTLKELYDAALAAIDSAERKETKYI